MDSKLFIPKTIRVGFQNRVDTYTGKLAYVIYYDEKNKLRKETSWNGWRDKNIAPVEFENKPTKGFVLNKGVHRYSDWGSGRHVIRIHDPREFEFEITVDNLTGILTHSDVSKREIVEEMVFAWAGSDLVLLPVNSEAYQQSVEYTDKQSNKVSTKSLVPGRLYASKKSDTQYMYIGFYECFNFSYVHDDYSHQHQKAIGKKHVFWSENSGYTTPSVSSFFSHEVSEDVSPQFADKCAKFFETTMGQKIVAFRFDDNGTAPAIRSGSYGTFYYKVDDSSFCTIGSYRDSRSPTLIQARAKTELSIVDGKFTYYKHHKERNGYAYWNRQDHNNYFLTGVVGNTPSIKVILTLENGKEITYDDINRH